MLYHSFFVSFIPHFSPSSLPQVNTSSFLHCHIIHFLCFFLPPVLCFLPALFMSFLLLVIPSFPSMYFLPFTLLHHSSGIVFASISSLCPFLLYLHFVTRNLSLSCHSSFPFLSPFLPCILTLVLYCIPCCIIVFFESPSFPALHPSFLTSFLIA